MKSYLKLIVLLALVALTASYIPQPKWKKGKLPSVFLNKYVYPTAKKTCLKEIQGGSFTFKVFINDTCVT